jgi:tetratricopeptide (TPR) repeat protein
LIPRLRLCAISIVLLFAAVARAAAPSADQLAAAHLVAEAEQMIIDAGHSDPLDTVEVRSAIAKLKRALKADPRNDGAYVDLGFSYALLKDAPTAVDMYRTATRINPSAANFKELADIYMRIGTPEEALMAANAGLSRDDRNAGLYNARGMALMDLERFDEAARDFHKALELDPSLKAAKQNLDALGSGYSGRATVSKQKQPAQ